MQGRALTGEARGVVARARSARVSRDGRRPTSVARPASRVLGVQKSRRSPSYAIASAETAEVEAEHVEENVGEKVAEGEAAAADPTEASSEAPKKSFKKRAPKNTEKIKEALSQLSQGDMIKGKVRKLESFGAFVDIGVGKDALIHISQLSVEFTKNVEDHLEVGQEVEARLMNVDVESLRIQLSLISEEDQKKQEQQRGEGSQKRKARRSRPKETLKVGEVIVGKVASVRPFGCFVELGDNKTGLMHVSEIIDEESLDTLADMNLEQGQKVEVVIAEINEKKREYKLRPTEKALKAMVPEEMVYVEKDSIPPAMPFFMSQFGVIRSMFPDKPSLSYIPVGLKYKTGRLPRNPDGKIYKIVGSTYSDASNWSDIIGVSEEEEVSKKKTTSLI